MTRQDAPPNDRALSRNTPSEAVAFTCPNCSAPLEGRTCKLHCTRCGYFESCSDLEPAPSGSSR